MPPHAERVFAVVHSIVPQTAVLTPHDSDRELSELGFDSMALVSLFIELEAEFDLSVPQLASCLHQRCTLRSVLNLCS